VAPLLPSPTLRAAVQPTSGRDGKAADQSNRKAVFAFGRLTSRSGVGSILVRQCPDRSGAFLDEAIRVPPRLSRGTLPYSRNPYVIPVVAAASLWITARRIMTIISTCDLDNVQGRDEEWAFQAEQGTGKGRFSLNAAHLTCGGNSATIWG